MRALAVWPNRRLDGVWRGANDSGCVHIRVLQERGIRCQLGGLRLTLTVSHVMGEVDAWRFRYRFWSVVGHRD